MLAERLATKRRDALCLPSSVAAFTRLAVAETEALESADPDAVRAFAVQLQAALKSVRPSKTYQLFTTYQKQEKALLSGVSIYQRGSLKQGVGEVLAASERLNAIQRQRVLGPPKCFTLGCTVNYENDIWRFDSKDDYTGNGLDKGNSILKPPGYQYKDPKAPGL